MLFKGTSRNIPIMRGIDMYEYNKRRNKFRFDLSGLSFFNNNLNNQDKNVKKKNNSTTKKLTPPIEILAYSAWVFDGKNEVTKMKIPKIKYITYQPLSIKYIMRDCNFLFCQ